MYAHLNEPPQLPLLRRFECVAAAAEGLLAEFDFCSFW